MELVKLVILAALVTLSSCDGSGDVPMPPEAREGETRQANLSRTYFGEEYYQGFYEADAVTGMSQYEMGLSYRDARYNCHERGTNGSITNRVPSGRVFTVFLQMPVIHFLNLPFKIRLMESIRTMLRIPGVDRDTRSETFSSRPEICIDGYDQAFVGEFEEGIMLRIYQPNSTTSGSRLANLFNGNRANFGQYGTPSLTALTRFEGETAVFYGLSSRAAVIGDVWPGRVSINLGGCRQLSREYNYYEGVRTTDLSCRSLSTDEQNDLIENLAENPNPLNLYLEAGDYVFAVLGSIAVAIVLALSVLGYCIHPFFLA